MLRDSPFWGRTTDVFTLQWHLTNACEAHCAHCYDRADYRALPLSTCLAVLDDFQAFCRTHGVRGQISLTGGNPLHHPDFWALYAAIVAADLRVSILGNPLDDATLARLVALRRPCYFQVSLEGLQPVNDALRGAGHFARTLAFLQRARALQVTTHVMLTLHRANREQVIPLGLSLEGLTRKFTFNRLAQVGDGHALAILTPDEYAAFLHDYLAVARTHPLFGVKDNLFNILRHRSHSPLLPGCTGQGCGAAFNFVALLPDGAVHACRKFPSPLGNLTETSLTTLYHSPYARRYRRGPQGCARCAIRPVCRGCMAVTYGAGGDPLRDRDPQCFR
jgi:selenobiotic family peptide radical SAM maturase